MALNGCGDQSNPGEMEHDYLSAGFDNDAVVDPFLYYDRQPECMQMVRRM